MQNICIFYYTLLCKVINRDFFKDQLGMFNDTFFKRASLYNVSINITTTQKILRCSHKCVNDLHGGRCHSYLKGC